jgi:tRNA pseudouridine55 synthase
MSFDFLNGEILLIDKPLAWTSFDVVNKVRKLIRIKGGIPKLKVGHAGTLDPMASGLLIICTGKMTKKIQELTLCDKVYTGTFLFGAITPSLDSETPVSETFPTDHITPGMLEELSRQFTGTMDQLPPDYSAKFIDGKRAYELARKNREVVLKPVSVEIKEFEITRIALPEVDFRVRCSKGTYIRSLARDFGKAAGSGAYLTALRRAKIGDFDVREALTVEQFDAVLEFLMEDRTGGL